MNPVRRLLALVGTAVVAAGLAIALQVAPSVDTLERDAVDFLGTDYLVVAVVGVLAGLLTLVAVAGRARSRGHHHTLPDPETVPSVPRLGAEFDQFVDGTVDPHLLISDEPDAVRDRLREAATAAVMHRDGCTRSVAQRQVDTGEWTDDVEAAAFLGGSTAPEPPWPARLDAAVQGQSWSQRGARRAARAIVRLAEVDPT